MEQEIKKTHWKSLVNPDYIGAYALMQGDKATDLVVKIKSIARQMVMGADGKKEECTVAQLEGQKPLILNATNSKTLTKLFGTPFIEDWAGKPFTLFVAKIKVAGETIDALRIRPTAPVITLPELTPKHPKWAGAITALKAGNTTIEQIKKSFTVSAENEKALADETI